MHGSGSCALAVRKWLLDHPCDCLAVCLPESFRYAVLNGVAALPTPSIVIQKPSEQPANLWSPDETDEQDDESLDDDALEFDETPPSSYVPIDPCQPVIMALRMALGERWHIEFCDLETDVFHVTSASLPDAYALRSVPLERFVTAVLPRIQRPDHEQVTDRLQHMAGQLKRFEKRFDKIVAMCSVLEWPWLREAYLQPRATLPEHDLVETPTAHSVNPNSLLFLLGELPYITGLYEKARAELDDDADLAIDGVKHLLMSARSSYQQDFGKRARKITPLMLSQCLKYIRNLTLMENRMTPDMYTLALATQQILGDQYAIHLIEAARSYPFHDDGPWEVTLGIDQARLFSGETLQLVSRLPGQPIQWRSLQLRRKPTKHDIEKWQRRWNPYSQCSWPPEDHLIESFRTRVADRAKAVIGSDLARSEKFSTSIMDGLDIRETLRHWYDREIYVKIMPPSVGQLDCVIMLFDSPADPRDYPWRTTWFAENQNESTLAFFATNFMNEVIGPGIATATYGGALFLFPPVSVPDIWQDARLDDADDLEERIIAAGCLHSNAKHIALLSPKAPGARWRKIVRKFRKQLVHLPLSQFNDAMIQQLRTVHVLDGKQVRSYAEHFIRKA